MSEPAAHQPDYRSWVSGKLIVAPSLLGLLLLALSFRWPGLGLLAAIALLCAAYFAYARHQFAPTGGDIQTRLVALVPPYLADWDGTGRVLDIGCGSGALTILLAKAHPRAQVTGVDYWGKSWEYSREVCERNARAEGVADRVTFGNASASSLPYGDGEFDVVVSNLTFHEVKDTKDKRELLREALRTLRKGGLFCFQDLFTWKQVYGDTDDLLESLRGWGVETTQFVDTSASPFIPSALKLPFMLGTVAVIYGRK